MPPKIAEDNFDGDLRTNTDGIGVHQPRRRVLGIGEKILHALTVLVVHRLQHLLGKPNGQLLENIR